MADNNNPTNESIGLNVNIDTNTTENSTENSTESPDVDMTAALQLYKLSFDDPEIPADSPFKHFIYSASSGRIMFPIAAYNLNMNDALKIATAFHGDMFEDEEHVMYIDTESVTTCMRLVGDTEADKFEAVTKKLLESTETSIMLKNYRGQSDEIN